MLLVLYWLANEWFLQWSLKSKLVLHKWSVMLYFNTSNRDHCLFRAHIHSFNHQNLHLFWQYAYAVWHCCMSKTAHIIEGNGALHRIVVHNSANLKHYVVSRQWLPSASRHHLTVPRHRRTKFGCQAFSVAARQPATRCQTISVIRRWAETLLGDH